MIYKAYMYQPRPWPRLLKQLCAFILTLFPIIAFYLILWRNEVRIPILDDYDIVLNLISWASRHHSPSARLVYMVTREHNGYKLIFDNAVVLGQYILLGRVHFLPLVIVGNLLALCIFIVVLCMSRVAPASTTDRWLLLTPVAWLVIQLQYASALDFASCSLQNLGVVFFALLCISWLDKRTKVAFGASCVALVFAIASSPSGFFVAPVGLVLLGQNKRWRESGVWAVTTAVILILYLFRYTTPVASEAVAGIHANPMTHYNLLYALSFMGSSVARFSSITPAVVLGVLFCGVVLVAVKLKYFRANPPVFYAMVLIIINALAVSGLRSDLGVAQSLASRYRIYSNLFLAFTYLFFVEAILPMLQRKSARRALFAAALLVSIAFGTLSDIAGANFLRGKKVALTINYRMRWQGRPTGTDINATELQKNPILQRQIKEGVYDIDLPSLREAVRDRIYDPPQNP